jgi:hypothetical protein
MLTRIKSDFLLSLIWQVRFRATNATAAMATSGAFETDGFMTKHGREQAVRLEELIS